MTVKMLSGPLTAISTRWTFSRGKPKAASKSSMLYAPRVSRAALCRELASSLSICSERMAWGTPGNWLGKRLVISVAPIKPAGAVLFTASDGVAATGSVLVALAGGGDVDVLPLVLGLESES